MARLFLVLLAVLGLIAVIVTIARTLERGAQSARATAQEVDVPDTVKTVSYILLIVLMFGVVTGWLGGL